jgi:hypothetical protein
METSLSIYEHRPSDQQSRGWPKSRLRRDQAKLGDEGQVVTRYPFWKERIDHLLSGVITGDTQDARRDTFFVSLITYLVSQITPEILAILLVYPVKRGD